MSLWRRSQKLSASDGVRLLLLRAFHRSAVTGQQPDRGLVPSETVRHVYPASQGQSWRGTMGTPEQSHMAKLPGKTAPGTMSRALVKKVMALSDVKEDVYGALDEWAAFELEFPLVATRMTLESLRKREQWHRVIQVTKWLFSKGLGKTHGSYALLLKAYCLEGRLEEAEELWDALLASLNRSMPKNLFAFMTNAYRRREMPDKVIQVFQQMESFGIKPDKDMLKRAEEAYLQLNMQDKVEQLGKRYAIDSKTRRREKRLQERIAKKAAQPEQLPNQEEGNAGIELQTDEDEDEEDKKQVTTVRDREERASTRTEELPKRTKSLQRGGKPHSPSTARKPDSLSAAEDEFVKQIIDTM